MAAEPVRPRSRLTARVRRDVLIDRSAYRFVASVASRPDPSLLARVQEEMADAFVLFEQRGWIDAPETYHCKPPPADALRVRDQRSGTIRFSTMTWPDSFASRPEEPGASRYAAYGENRIASAALLEHRTGSRPWVLCIHGFGMGSPALDMRAFRALHLHRDLGLNVAFVTLPLHGRRKPAGTRLAAMPGVDMLDNVHGLAQAVWDVRQLLAHLRERGDGPIALLGLSLGALVSALVASLDDVDAALLLAPAVDLGTLMAEAADKSDAENPLMSLPNLELAKKILAPVSPLRLRGRLPRDRCFIAAATLDQFARPASQAEALWHHWGEPNLYWSHGGHVSLMWSRGVQRAVDEALARFGMTTNVDTASS